MNRAVSRLDLPFKLTHTSRAIGLLAAFALLVLSVPQAEAQCFPAKRFTSGSPPLPTVTITLPPNGTGDELGWLWQSDRSSINNFGGGCPPTSWLKTQMTTGRAYIDGTIGNPDCIWNGCPQGEMTLVLEDQRVDDQDAYLLALRAPENMLGVFDFGCTPPPPTPRILLFRPFPGISVLASTLQFPNVHLSLELDGADPNVYACPDPFPLPTSSTIESYALLTHYGPTDPGRHRSFWTTVAIVPYVDGASFPLEVSLPCPPDVLTNGFLALGVDFHGGADGPVPSTLVSASIAFGGDSDTDGWAQCEGDCDDTAENVYPGAAQDCDGVNNDCAHVNWPALNNTNEFDDDGDGLSECEGDCDDTTGGTYPGAPQVCDGVNNDCTHANWPALNNTNEFDHDGDGLSECEGDCDDTTGEIYPGAPQVCDGVNNDCAHANWPSLVNTNEFDDDGDGLSECEGDCDDTDRNNWGSCATCSDDDEDDLYVDCDAYVTIDGPDNCPEDYNPAQTDDDLDEFGQPCDCDDADPQTYPGAPEVNDGLDNQCPGDPGDGEIDETSGDSGFHDPEDTTAYSWPAQEGATRYEVARATRADFDEDCVLIHTAEHQVETSWIDEQVPEPGEIFFYANRPIESHVGSWGDDSTGDQRHLSCISYVWGFVDGNDDDVGSTSLYEFLDATPAGPSDYIRVWVFELGWCAERADFYRDSYLQLAPVGGTANSGTWPKWQRTSPFESWNGPDTASYPNHFGNACWNPRPYAWSSERGLIGDLNLFVNPDDPTFCEAEFIDTACFATPMALEVRIAGTFADACDAPVPTVP